LARLTAPTTWHQHLTRPRLDAHDLRVLYLSLSLCLFGVYTPRARRRAQPTCGIACPLQYKTEPKRHPKYRGIQIALARNAAFQPLRGICNAMSCHGHRVRGLVGFEFKNSSVLRIQTHEGGVAGGSGNSRILCSQGSLEVRPTVMNTDERETHRTKNGKEAKGRWRSGDTHTRYLECSSSACSDLRRSGKIVRQIPACLARQRDALASSSSHPRTTNFAPISLKVAFAKKNA
jgi:hypothetical protein